MLNWEKTDVIPRREYRIQDVVSIAKIVDGSLTQLLDDLPWRCGSADLTRLLSGQELDPVASGARKKWNLVHSWYS